MPVKTMKIRQNNRVAKFSSIFFESAKFSIECITSFHFTTRRPKFEVFVKQNSYFLKHWKPETCKLELKKQDIQIIQNKQNIQNIKNIWTSKYFEFSKCPKYSKFTEFSKLNNVPKLCVKYSKKSQKTSNYAQDEFNVKKLVI